MSTEGTNHLNASRGASVATFQIEALLATLEGTTDARERAEIFVEIARRFRDDLGDEGQAIDALLEAWKTYPNEEAIIDVLEPLVREAGRWPEVLELSRTLASAERETTRAIAYAEAMVRWLTSEVSEPALARQWLERIRGLDTTHWQLHMLQAAMSREHGDLKRELDELDRAVLSARRADDRARIHLLMATRYLDDRMRNLVEAKKHFAAAHKLSPRSMDALRGLEQLARADQDNTALVDILRRQSEADVDDALRVDILVALAKIEEEEFRKPDLAAKTLERVLAIAAAHVLALEGLERTYGASRAWPELAVVLERAVGSTTDPSLRMTRLQRLGEVLETKLGDARAAIASYERLVKMLPDDETLLGELARLHEKVGDVPSAVRYREQLAESAPNPSIRARMHVLAGQLLVAVDGAAARAQFERAALADPANQAAWSALLWDARADGDVARVERYLEDRAWKTETPRARASAFVELAEARTKRGDHPGARRAFDEASAADPTNETAAVALVSALVEEGRYAEAELLCEVAISAAERDKDYDRMVTVRRAQAAAATALGKPEVALVASLAAYQVRGEELEIREALVAAAVPMRADPQILTAREALVAIADRPEGLSVHALAGLADVLVLTGDAERAAVLYDAVLAESPDHGSALAGLSQHHTAAGNAVAALSLKRQMAHALEDPDERYAALVAVAEAFSARAGHEELAANVYEEARVVRPQDLPTLHKLLGLYPKLEKWVSLFDVLRSIAASDGDPARKAKTLSTMAHLAIDQLGDRGRALGLFEETLEVDPSQLVAFENIVRLLTEDRDWAGLEQAYARMIERASDLGVPLRRALYKQIGLVYRDRLGHPQRAIVAYQMAVQLGPEDEEAQTILRELLSRTGQSHDAVAVTLERIVRDPLVLAPYPVLFDLLFAQGARDRALCVASAMALLGIAHPGAEALRGSYRRPAIEEIAEGLGEDGYRELLHPDLDAGLTELFEVVAPALVDIVISRLPLRERISHPGPALKGHDWLVQAVARAAAILGAPSPRVFQRRAPGPPIVHAATKPASLLAHPPAFVGVAGEVVAFLVGKRVFEVSPPLLARALCPSFTELKGLVQSAARIATGQAEPGDAPLKERLKREDVARITTAVQHARSAGGGTFDVLRWSRAADVSACRAGLLLTGDLEAVRAAIALEAQAPSDLTPRAKMSELVAWYLGDACAALRKRLGVALR